MNLTGMCVWGDSIAKGIVFDESRGRYAVYKDNCLNKLSREYNLQISNYSVMGQTSVNGLMRMRPEDLKSGQIAVVEYGGNDCDLDWKEVSAHPERRQQGKVPLEQFTKNITEMIRRLRDAGMKPLLVTPPPLVSERYFQWVSKGLNPENILAYLGEVDEIYAWQKRYADRVSEIAENMRVDVLDVRGKMLQSDNYADLMCVDGIHPNQKGHELIYKAATALL